jgi:hypothetical protein
VHAVVGGFRPGTTSFLVMNPDFHFALAMDVIVCTVGVGNVLRTMVCTSATVLEGLTDPVIMPSKEEHGCDSGSESLDKHDPRGILQ